MKIKLLKYYLTAVITMAVLSAAAQLRQYYKEPQWQPRIFVPYDDAINDNFWPKSPEVLVSYNDPGFDDSRLGEVPKPGVHPRVLITPTDLKIIRNKVAMGDKAPFPFRMMWERVKKSQSPFYALVTKNKVLGRQYADQLVAKLKLLEPKIDFINKQPDAENLWTVDRSIIAMGNPDPPTEIWDLIEYDYIAEWMTKEEKELARRVIARITERRVSNFMQVPDHFMNNNHEGFGMEYIRLMLLIEGEKGYNKELFELASKKSRAMLDWFLDGDGMCYETIKGWLNTSAFVAVGLRDRDLLKHSHLMAKMRFFHAAMWFEDGKWKIRDEMRASAFHPIWMMHYFHPNDQSIDFLYKASLDTHDFLLDPDVKWPNPVGICNELLLLFADNGMTRPDGPSIDWNDPEDVKTLKLPTTWKDDQRGYVYWRNSWNPGDMQIGYSCKQDFFYGGHEGTEDNRIILWKDGINWIKDNHMLATKATFLQNMMTIDGKGCKWPPVPCTWLGMKESKDALTASGDGRMGYSYSKSSQVHPLWFPTTKIPYYAPFAEGNYDLTRDIQVAFHPNTVKYNDGYAHTDYGPWSGEGRLVEGYKEHNMMEQFFRTIQIGKGNYPYLIIMDDARKDNASHLYEWNVSVPLDVDLIEALTPEIRFQNTDPSPFREDDLILGKAGLPRDPGTGKSTPQKGEPLCLIRVLWRNSDYGFPVPRFERYQGYNQVVVPAISQSPEFRILVYPFRFGDPMPQTSWNSDRTELTVTIGKISDIYRFSQTDGGRTVSSLERNGKKTLISDAKPARPVLKVRNQRFDAYALRDTRKEGIIPEFCFVQKETVEFERAHAPAQIYYTLDGSEPNEKSLVYEDPIAIDKSCTLKAKTFNPVWEQGAHWSTTVEARFSSTEFAKGLNEKPADTSNGLCVSVYEINTKPYNDKGFFEASKVMMPRLTNYKQQVSTGVAGFVLPQTVPQLPMKEESKGFYRFAGYFYAPQDGIFSFAVNSCGPVTFDIGGQTAIEETGIFHQQQAVRKGDAALGKGWHKLELVVCDPLYWNINSLDRMPLEVSYSVNKSGYMPVSANQLCYSANGLNLQPQPEIGRLSPEKELPELEPGFELSFYDKTDKRRDPGYLDVENEVPFRISRVNKLESSEGTNVIQVYNGYFYAPLTGIYSFDTPKRNGESGSLGTRQATCQNQLKIGNTVVVQRGVYGRNPVRQVLLEKGWYPISLRFGVSGTECTITYPDGQVQILNSKNVFRYKVQVNMPVQHSSTVPVGEVNLLQWNGKSGDFALKGKFMAWIGRGSKLVDTERGKALLSPGVAKGLSAAVDVNVSRGTTNPGVKVYNLKLRENAISVCMWFKTDQTEGGLFGKTGYNAFGKGYRTVSCAIRSGSLIANPGSLIGSKVEPGTWHHVVLSASENSMNLYLDGQLVALGNGTTEISTDALDFCLDHPAVISDIQIYEYPLSGDEVKNIYAKTLIPK